MKKPVIDPAPLILINSNELFGEHPLYTNRSTVKPSAAVSAKRVESEVLKHRCAFFQKAKVCGTKLNDGCGDESSGTVGSTVP